MSDILNPSCGLLSMVRLCVLRRRNEGDIRREYLEVEVTRVALCGV